MWKVYEWLVSKIVHDRCHSNLINVKCDTYITGKISEEERQVDIFINYTSNNFKIAIDCKKYTKNVDIKDVESFIGMCEDLGVDLGVLISSKVFSKGAKKRARFNNNVKLITLEWEKVFKSVTESLEYYKEITDIFTICTKKENIVPGIILWDTPYTFLDEDDCAIQVFTGQCLSCKSKFLHCGVCGATETVINKRYICSCCDVEYEIN